ncbi:MAG: GNAT family N-acetyltransferase [Dehalococcoidia bacterium]
MREATADDVQAVTELVNLAYRVEDFFKIGDRTDADDVAAHLRKGRFLLVEDARGLLLGSVYVEINGPDGYFGMLASRPGQQGRGLGRFLVSAAEDACRVAGCTEMGLTVVNLREELPPWYQRLGYHVTGTEPFPPGERVSRPCHFLVMTKRLT